MNAAHCSGACDQGRRGCVVPKVCFATPAYRNEHDANVHGFACAPCVDTQPSRLSWRLADIAIALIFVSFLLAYRLGVFQ